MYGRTDGWMVNGMDTVGVLVVWVNGWLDGWMGGRVDG